MGELIDKVKGRIKQAIGGLTGDRGKQVEGYVDEKKGEVKEGFERVKQEIRRDPYPPNPYPSNPTR